MIAEDLYKRQVCPQPTCILCLNVHLSNHIQGTHGFPFCADSIRGSGGALFTVTHIARVGAICNGMFGSLSGLIGVV